MGFGKLFGELESAAGGSANLEQTFSQVASNVPQQGLAGALTHAFQSDQTPPFSQMLGNIFGGSNDDQKAGLLSRLVATLGPELLQSGALGSLGALVAGGGKITPQQAAQVDPQAVQQMAEQAQQQNPSIIQEAGNFYAQHPTAVKAVGAASLAFILSHLTKK